MTAVGTDRRTPAVTADAGVLREFVRANTLEGEDYTLALLGAIYRLERLALLTAQRGITSALTHIAKTKRPTDTHCGRPSEVVNHVTEESACTDILSPALCRRCVNLFVARVFKTEGAVLEAFARIERRATRTSVAGKDYVVHIEEPARPHMTYCGRKTATVNSTGRSEARDLLSEQWCKRCVARIEKEAGVR